MRMPSLKHELFFLQLDAEISARERNSASLRHSAYRWRSATMAPLFSFWQSVYYVGGAATYNLIRGRGARSGGKGGERFNFNVPSVDLLDKEAPAPLLEVGLLQPIKAHARIELLQSDAAVRVLLPQTAASAGVRCALVAVGADGTPLRRGIRHATSFGGVFGASCASFCLDYAKLLHEDVTGTHTRALCCVSKLCEFRSLDFFARTSSDIDLAHEVLQLSLSSPSKRHTFVTYTGSYLFGVKTTCTGARLTATLCEALAQLSICAGCEAARTACDSGQCVHCLAQFDLSVRVQRSAIRQPHLLKALLQPCARCWEAGYTSLIAPLRPCSRCHELARQTAPGAVVCARLAPISLAADNASTNAVALRSMRAQHAVPSLLCDCVHFLRAVRNHAHNYWLFIDGAYVSLSAVGQMRMSDDKMHTAVRDAVARLTDKMSTALLLSLCSDAVLEALRSYRSCSFDLLPSPLMVGPPNGQVTSSPFRNASRIVPGVDARIYVVHTAGAVGDAVTSVALTSPLTRFWRVVTLRERIVTVAAFVASDGSGGEHVALLLRDGRVVVVDDDRVPGNVRGQVRFADFGRLR